MIKTMIHMEVNKDDRKYAFFCDPTAPLGEIHDVLCMMKHEIVKQITDAHKKEEESKKEGP